MWWHKRSREVTLAAEKAALRSHSEHGKNPYMGVRHVKWPRLTSKIDAALDQLLDSKKRLDSLRCVSAVRVHAKSTAYCVVSDIVVPTTAYGRCPPP
ncbi:hypothetical protein MRX96_001493 [Rhipicephalus microplus]